MATKGNYLPNTKQTIELLIKVHKNINHSVYYHPKFRAFVVPVKCGAS